MAQLRGIRLVTCVVFVSLGSVYALSFIRAFSGSWGWNGSDFWLQNGLLRYTWDVPFPVYSLPLLPPLVIVAVPTILAWCLRPRFLSGCCPNCGYDLAENTTGVCPECGRAAITAPGRPGV